MVFDAGFVGALVRLTWHGLALGVFEDGDVHVVRAQFKLSRLVAVKGKELLGTGNTAAEAIGIVQEGSFHWEVRDFRVASAL